MNGIGRHGEFGIPPIDILAQPAQWRRNTGRKKGAVPSEVAGTMGLLEWIINFNSSE